MNEIRELMEVVAMFQNLNAQQEDLLVSLRISVALAQERIDLLEAENKKLRAAKAAEVRAP